MLSELVNVVTGLFPPARGATPAAPATTLPASHDCSAVLPTVAVMPGMSKTRLQKASMSMKYSTAAATADDWSQLGLKQLGLNTPEKNDKALTIIHNSDASDRNWTQSSVD